MNNTIKIIIFCLSIVLSIIYLLAMYKKKKNIKHFNKFIVIAVIFVLLVNLFSLLLLPKNEKQKSKKTITTTSKIITSTTNISSTTKETTTTSKKMVTTNKVTNPATGKTSKGYTIEYKDGAYYIDNILIANKTYKLSSSFVPANTYTTITSSMGGFCNSCINKEAYSAWLQMKSDASAIGLNIWIQSGWRSYDYQEALYNKYVSRSGKEAADTYSARPGASEHQTGLSFDLNSVDSSFANTAEGKWVNDNAYLYGYIIRFPNGKSDETGYKYESWHLRYVGKDLAKQLYNNGNWITLESYLGITSEYQD
jgi:D-alanyl-D-alanine carboxypeptidase